MNEFHEEMKDLQKRAIQLPRQPTQFANNTSDALACREAVLEHFRVLFSPQAMVLRHGAPRSQDEQAAIVSLRGHHFEDYRRFPSLPVFFWSKATADVVRAASKSYPLPDMANAPFVPAGLSRGFAVFEAPVLGAQIDNEAAVFSALSWETLAAAKYDNWPVLSLTGYHWAGSMCAPTWWATVGAHWLELPDDPTFADEQATLLRWLLAAVMFMEQSILESSADRVGGQVGKRAERAKLSRDVHVISLRRVIRSAHASGEESVSRDWDHRWMVRGHWRRQWYPKAERNVPIFIQPHIKGPEDKPLKTPSADVFAVTR